MVAKMTYAREGENSKLEASYAPYIEMPWVMPRKVLITGATGECAKPGATRLNSGALPFAPIEDAIVQNPASAAG
jgi:hypothetical protein